ncbi:MAG TPA: lipoyl(octanoyl) transferase LipB [Thermoanaerobaculia bacterium]|jgi:lipoyl(octanoyl) transferase|nr:lipoyl(octanoyl) transferase LipB [Thermoanaerobaculia bacterium]
MSAMSAGPRRLLRWDYLGRVPYAEAVRLQLDARSALKAGEGPERLFLLEHPHVYTLGRNASEADVLASPEWLRARGVEVAECDRGGQVTYHGPGQLVGYPVVNLSPDRRDVRRYVRDLQETLIRTLADYGIEAEGRDGQAFVGVWAGEEKIASIGVHLSRWITTHGFALNVSTDLSYFSGIIPCGLHQVRMTSIERLTGRAPVLPEVAEVYARHFGEIFDRDLATTSLRLQAAGT